MEKAKGNKSRKNLVEDVLKTAFVTSENESRERKRPKETKPVKI